MRIIIEDVEHLEGGRIWLAAVSPKDVSRIGKPASSKNGSSVVLLKGEFMSSGKTLSFNPDEVSLLNLGSSDHVVFIADTGSLPSATKQSKKSGFESVKDLCRRHLQAEFAVAVCMMLGKLETESADDLIADKTNRWISRPDNYFTIKVQPQNKDVVFTIRGREQEYESGKIEMRPDQNGYSKFWVRNSEEVTEALRIIRAARRRGRLRE